MLVPGPAINKTLTVLGLWWSLVYDNLHEGYIWLNSKSDKLTRHTDYFRVNYTVSPSSSLLWLLMTRHYRHGNFTKILQHGLNESRYGKILTWAPRVYKLSKILISGPLRFGLDPKVYTPVMGTSREVVGRCSCRDDIFF